MTVTSRPHGDDERALNEAKWAACNTRFLKGGIPSMEDLSEAVENALRAYFKAVGGAPAETCDHDFTDTPNDGITCVKCGA